MSAAQVRLVLWSEILVTVVLLPMLLLGPALHFLTHPDPYSSALSVAFLYLGLLQPFLAGGLAYALLIILGQTLGFSRKLLAILASPVVVIVAACFPQWTLVQSFPWSMATAFVAYVAVAYVAVARLQQSTVRAADVPHLRFGNEFEAYRRGSWLLESPQTLDSDLEEVQLLAKTLSAALRDREEPLSPDVARHLGAEAIDLLAFYISFMSRERVGTIGRLLLYFSPYPRALRLLRDRLRHIAKGESTSDSVAEPIPESREPVPRR